MRKNIIQSILFAPIVIYLISCASSDDDKYNLITKEDKKTIDEFCKCTEPVQPFMERFVNLMKDTANAKKFILDSAYMKPMLDSMDILLREAGPCAEKAKNLFERHDMSKEKEEQLLSYFKKYYPKCLLLVLDEVGTDSVKIK